MNTMKEFVAFSRKLLRILKKIRSYMEKGENEKALEMLSELIEDTEKDIEA